MSNGEPKQGDKLDDRYVLGREIGRGGHGAVYAAQDIATGEPVAVKILHQNIAEDRQYAVRLWREAEALAMLWGESVVKVHHFGHTREGAVYLAMELLVGETLDEYLYGLEDFGDRMSAFDMLCCLDPIARALHTAHAKGLIHRDVKPANIFRVDAEHGGGVRLMDFGLVKIAGAEALTQIGLIAGSPNYIAPEVWRSEAFDHRIDVYSLGAVVFRCLAGYTPFTAPSPLDLFIKVTQDPRPRLTEIRPELHPEIDAWLARSLAVDKADRYPFVTTMWNELIRIVANGSSPSAHKTRVMFHLPE